MAHRLRLILRLLGVVVALAVTAAYWTASSAFPPPRLLLSDIAVVSLLGGATGVAAWRRQARWMTWIQWAVCGALLAAAIVGIWSVALWVFLAALAFAGAGMVGGMGRRRAIVSRLGLLCAAGLLNFAFLCAVIQDNPMRVSPAEFQATDLRVHALLADVPLHDVWAFHLRGGGEGRTLRDVEVVRSAMTSRRANPVVIGLVGLRLALGRVLGWDSEKHDDPASSFFHRLTDADRARSLEEPGSLRGSWRIIYTFENEALIELINATVHALLLTALVPADDGYRLYLAVYVKSVSWITPFYMAIIDPFRRLFVYPDIIMRLERAWSAQWKATEHTGG
ncbi:MAG: DUF2867 domain-containing protein [Gemmatimonadales bacterium]|nr:DUF2867 domain-containing protein [Gemmatimonadales bacterium]